MREQLPLPMQMEPSSVRPHPERLEPALWVSRVLLLREQRIAVDTVIRDICLHRGLNILWAQPTPAPSDPDRPAGKVTGHSAGKTTFCRLIRYLLGEKRFGTPWLQGRIREKIADGWIVGEVFVRGQPWILSRPFARWEHRFANRGGSMEAALADGGSYQDFQAALEEAVAAPMPVQTLPHGGARIDWPHLLPWLARDQEARFSGIVEWRATASESDSPNPPVSDRHVLARTVLGVMTSEESALEQKLEGMAEERRQLDTLAPDLTVRARGSREQLASRLGLRSEDVPEEPLFVNRLRDEVLKRREAAVRQETALAEHRAEVERAEQEWTETREAVATRREALGKLKQQVEHQADFLRKIDAAEAGAKQASLLAAMPAPLGRCNVPIDEARANGCVLAVEAPASLEARRGRREEAVEIAQERQKLTDLADAEAAAKRAAGEADVNAEAKKRAYFTLNTALVAEQGRIERERGALGEIEELLVWTTRAQERSDSQGQERAKLAQKMEQLQVRKSAGRKTHREGLGQLTHRFETVVRELLGTDFGGRVELSDGKLVPHVTDRGELRGAAMDTVGVLAFDLAALTLGIEGHGFFPGFLIHDGPREADLELPIYAQLFHYAARLEKAFPGPAGFQYIVTTTTAPPVELQEARWLLDPMLDASVREGRLLKEDL